MKSVCIIGCGNIGNLHAKNLTGKVNLYFHNRTREKADRSNKSFKGSGVFDKFEDVLPSSEIDAVVIATPPEVHKEQVVQSLKAGKAVLVEKPMCVSAEETREIGHTLESLPDAILMVAENYHYKPSLTKIKELIRVGFIGRVNSLEIKKVFNQESPGWKSKHGALFEGGIHFIAMISAIMEDSPIKVNAEFPGKKREGPERNSIVRLIYPKGESVKLTYSWNTSSLTKGLFQKSVIRGSQGSIVFESNGIYVTLKSSRKSKRFLTVSDLMGFGAMTEDFVKCLEDGGAPAYGFGEAKRDLDIVFEAYRGL